YQVAVVLNDPLAGVIAFDSQATLAFTGEHVVNFFGNGVNLPPTLARGNDEEIIKRCDRPHVEYEHIAGLVFRSQPGDPASQFGARLASTLVQGRDLQRPSFLISVSGGDPPLPGGGLFSWITSITCETIDQTLSMRSAGLRPCGPSGPSKPHRNRHHDCQFVAVRQGSYRHFQEKDRITSVWTRIPGQRFIPLQAFHRRPAPLLRQNPQAQKAVGPADLDPGGQTPGAILRAN